MASQVVAIVNQRRAEAGCGPVSEDAGLAAVAFAHSADMGTRNYFAHDTPEGLSPWDRAAAGGVSASGENIAAGQTTAESVMESWMNSQGHKDNILNCGQTKLGVGVAQGSGDYRIYWTQLFS
ncbi:CAP domain-containing protein [Salinibacterium sp.]|uniref:CAP domain-containing protein n=1 Tax=Salinibacterium sp. TaxID=1915057 RepID=UPI00286B04AB|nr:CAP domain-containing protein [Salinibacterium sp.]